MSDPVKQMLYESSSILLNLASADHPYVDSLLDPKVKLKEFIDKVLSIYNDKDLIFNIVWLLANLTGDKDDPKFVIWVQENTEITSKVFHIITNSDKMAPDDLETISWFFSNLTFHFDKLNIPS